MHEPREVIAVAIDLTEVVDRHGVRAQAAATVLVGDTHGQHLEPDPFEVDPSDVLPRDDSNQLALVLDEAQPSALEAGSRQVVEPRECRRSDPVLYLVLKRRTARTGETGESSGVAAGRIELAQDHRVDEVAKASRSRSAGERICGPPGTR